MMTVTLKDTGVGVHNTMMTRMKTIDEGTDQDRDQGEIRTEVDRDDSYFPQA